MDWRKIYQAVGESQSAGGVASATFTREQLANRACAFYNDELRSELEVSRPGAFVVIDGDTLDYEVDENDLIATLRLLEKDPASGPHLWHHRIGFDATYRVGFAPRER